jgi:hypothetical protein
MRPGLLASGAAVALACAPAVRTPAAEPQRPAAELPAAGPGKTAEPSGGLLANARAAFARRPDVAQVRRAEDLFLSAADAAPPGVDGLYGAVLAQLWLARHGPHGERGRHATEAIDTAQRCTQRGPDDARCDYALALALGVQAQAHPTSARDALSRMADHLRHAAARDPALDEAGPQRVLAVLLLRAPGWPIGPGDASAGLAEARKAAARAPEYAPNQLALGEGLIANGELEAGRAAVQKGLALAEASRQAGDPDAPEWIADGQRILAIAAQKEPTPGGPM